MPDEKASAPKPPTKPGAGLEGMVAGDSSICFIDGQQGILRYRGYDITDLAVGSTFEEVVWLLWKGDLPKQAELDSFRAELASSIALPTAVVEAMQIIPKSVHPMGALRTLVSIAGNADPDAECDPLDVAANLRKATRLLGQTSAICAAWDRHRKGAAPVAPDLKLGFAANFLFMLTGEAPSETSTRVFDECLVLHADHEFNASTFTARVIAATLPDLHSAIGGALGALKGPLHGGANTAVMKMLLEIDGKGGAPVAAQWIKEALAQKKKIMGFGHRVYKTDDPRATRLKKLSEMVAKDKGEGDGRWYSLSNEFATALQAQKNLPANVDFFSASTYFMLGIAPDMFTPIFALSRTSGWVAHVLEQFANNRLIRPLSNYVGPGARPYPPMGSR
ncbi:MAG: citrate/2-methylcitrate synthase [Polyangiales bacterium]